MNQMQSIRSTNVLFLGGVPYQTKIQHAVLFNLKTVIRLETVFVVGCVFTQVKLNAKCNICKAKSAFVSIQIV